MDKKARIGEVSRATGIPPKTIRFYEDEGLIPSPARNDAGYRVYAPADLTRLHFIRGARLLGVSLPEIRTLLDRALGDDCAAFGTELNDVLNNQLADIEQRLSELTALRDDIVRLQAHVTHCCDGCPPGLMATECNFCGVSTEEKGGASNARETDSDCR